MHIADIDHEPGPSELTDEEVAKARIAFETTFTDVADQVMDQHTGSTAARLFAGVLAGVAAGVGGALRAIYDGEPGDVLLGTPTQARAWRALRDHGDAEFFLQVHGGRSGLEAMNEKLAGLAEVLAQEAAHQDAERYDPEAQRVAEEPRFGDERDSPRPATFDAFTVSEMREWATSVTEALDQVATWRSELREMEIAALARGAQLEPELQAAAQLSDEDLLLRALKGDMPRGYARGGRHEQRRLEYVERRRKRLLKAAVE